MTSADGSPRIVAAVSYFRDDSVYPRAGSENEQDDTYWANIAVNAATFRHLAGPDAEFVVFARDTPRTSAAAVLAEAGAKIRTVDFASCPPPDFYESYTGSLYVLDTMPVLASEMRAEDVVMFVDPDVVWVRPIDPLVAEIRRGGVVAYELAVPDTRPMCGISRREQGTILGEITGRGPDAPFTHFGGEFYGMTGAELPGLVEAIDRVWEGTIKRYGEGLSHYHVEEHVLNAVLWQRREQEGRADPYLQRIRTLPRPFGTRECATPGLVAWHLPMEKNNGFLRAFDHLRRGRALPGLDEGYERWLGAVMGVAPRGGRWLADRARQVKWAVTRRAHGAEPHYGL